MAFGVQGPMGMSSILVGAGAASVTGITTREPEGGIVGTSVGGGAGTRVEDIACEVDVSGKIVVKDGRPLLNDGYVIVDDWVSGLEVKLGKGLLPNDDVVTVEGWVADCVTVVAGGEFVIKGVNELEDELEDIVTDSVIDSVIVLRDGSVEFQLGSVLDVNVDVPGVDEVVDDREPFMGWLVTWIDPLLDVVE
ncbi:hypothetical protein MaudCBS49596_002704 [Microsporum audouinii]